MEKTGDREITFVFDAPGNRELPQIVGQLLMLPKHYWEGTDKNGNKRDIGATTLEPPLGSGPYRIMEFSAGRNIVGVAKGLAQDWLKFEHTKTVAGHQGAVNVCKGAVLLHR